jgi:hypothetical protein
MVTVSMTLTIMMIMAMVANITMKTRMNAAVIMTTILIGKALMMLAAYVVAAAPTASHLVNL